LWRKGGVKGRMERKEKGGMEWAAVNAGRQFASWPSGVFIRDVHFGGCKALFIGLNTIYFESMYRLSSCTNSVCIGGLFTSQCVVDVPGKQKSTAARSGLQFLSEGRGGFRVRGFIFGLPGILLQPTHYRSQVHVSFEVLHQSDMDWWWLAHAAMTAQVAEAVGT